jgi:Aldolase/RraA
MWTGKDRVRLIAVGKPVTIPRIEIRPGDLVCADADGVVVPAAEAAGIVDVAERIERVEAATVAAARRQHAARSPRAAPASATTPACEVARPALDGRTTGAITPAAVIGSALALA